MHTSTMLRSADFRFVQRDGNQRREVDFAAFCPDYRTTDRVAVVSPNVGDGIISTGGALLALTTAFYDRLRSRATDFYDYPHHFAILGAPTEPQPDLDSPDAENMALEQGWVNLDVWPASQWLHAPTTASAMLRKVCDYQISRLFWPADLLPAADEDPLPPYTSGLLAARLKSVFFYNTRAQTIEVWARQPADDIIQASLRHLPPTNVVSPPAQEQTPRHQSMVDGFVRVDGFQEVAVSDFLEAMHPVLGT
jgi:hypothetical protein